MKSEIYLVKGVCLKNMYQNIRRRSNLYIFRFTNIYKSKHLQIKTFTNNNILLKQIKYIEIYNK